MAGDGGWRRQGVGEGKLGKGQGGVGREHG